MSDVGLAAATSDPVQSHKHPVARFTKYLTTILRSSHDRAKVIQSTYDGRLIFRNILGLL